ncbi:protein kinase [Streptomyces sp. ID05-04B]|uniref:serine/threonine-protein kinase n=1 Tax=unclassified Streptomyces TaxID=2593676 RepID=UPI000D1B3824|nr:MULTISPECIES: serine/threonine-protein kinase [unclassified Streptomyces]AVV41113.1 serine/threonine protein kinase [Streptomyces sp. P3]MDX5568691.1 protein kinase [Streptomyces sp. ID05-04B]
MQPLGDGEPTTVGPYRLLGRLGSGGMGRVYLGRSAGGRTVAVKIVHPHLALDEEFRARFRREVEAARRVGGAWTAPVLDADPEATVPWVATGYAAGPSLAAAVASGGALPEHSVRVLGAGLAEALGTVHELGLVHRDVKPSNVLLTVDGPLLIDFGIARATDGTASLTSTGVSVGSPGYMAPEQILGRGASGAADVFSLGAVLVYAATGQSPFPGDSSAALLYKVVHEEPEFGSPEGGLRGELRAVAEACLAKDPAARPSPAEVARRLAPEGAARLVAAGWLPGALVEQLGRSAVQLLNLEGTHAGAEPAASGPVGFASAALTSGEPTGAPSGSASAGEPQASPGVFGPPPVMDAIPATPATPAGRADRSVAVPVPTPRDAGPATADAAPSGPSARSERSEHAGGSDGRGRLSVTVAGSATPGEGGRGRRLSCTVALAVAGAMAAVTVGSVLLFHLLPDDGGQDTEAGSDAYSPMPTAAATPGATGGQSPTASPGATDGSSAAALPARYVGTWEGQGSGLDGALPMGTFRVTVQQAVVGGKLGELRQTDVLGGVCVDVLTLKQVTAKEVVATSVGVADNHGGCNPKPHPIRLTPTGDDLTYTSDSAAEGNPVARMSKVE